MDDDDGIDEVLEVAYLVGRDHDYPPGLGGRAVATVAVTPNEVLQVNVGGQGGDATNAGQTGGAVVLARVRPDTLSALALWGEGRRAQEVALAPVSALLGAGAAE